MQRLAHRLSVALVFGIAVAAFAASVTSRDDRDAPETGLSPSGSTSAPREAAEEETFSADGYSFSYPAAWATGRARVTKAGRSTTAFGWKPPNAISSSTSGEALVLVAEPLVERDLDPYVRLMRKRLAKEGERPLQAPTRVTVAGLPAVHSAVEFPDGAVRRYTAILDRRTVYLLTCTFVSEAMKRGCDRVESSFAVE